MDEILSKTLTTGGAGMTGSYVDFGIKYDRNELDITNLDQVLSVCHKLQPKTILHLAAATNVDRCEKDPEYAYRVNTFGTYNIAVGAKSCGAKLIYISTAGVFNGEKVDLYSDSDIDSAEPQNHYSKSKYLGEIAVKHLLKDYLIFRTGWLFGGGPKKDRKFVGKILNSILHEKKKVLSVVNDTKGTPTYCKDLIDIVKKSILSNVRGVFLLGNAGYATRHDMASFIVSVLHTRTQVKIVNSDIFQLDVRRISSEAFNTSPHFNTRSWKKALQEYINREWLYKND